MGEIKTVKSYTVDEAIGALLDIQLGIKGLESPMNFSLLLQGISQLLESVVQYEVMAQIGRCKKIELPQNK